MLCCHYHIETTQPLELRLPLDHHIASCSRTSTTRAIACYGCLAGPIACLDCTRVADDLVVVLVLVVVGGLAEL